MKQFDSLARCGGAILLFVSALSSPGRTSFETYGVQGTFDSSPIVRSESVATSWEGGAASAGAGNLSSASSSSQTSVLGGGNIGSGYGGGSAWYENSRFLLDPEWVGQLGYVTLTGSVQAAASGSTVTNEFGFTARNNGIASAGASFGTDSVSFNTGYTTEAEQPPLGGLVSQDVALLAGRAFSLSVSASASASVNYYGMGGGASATASANLSFQLFLTEDRLHWISADSVLQGGAPAQWAEGLALTARRYAVFNDAAGRTLSLALAQNQEWRGLAVDGENLSLNLGGSTLTLGGDGPSVASHNIVVGEGSSIASTLTLTNGTARLDHDIIVGRSASGPGTLILDQGVTVREQLDSIRAVLGVAGEGNLTVRGGSSLSVSEVSLGSLATGKGHVEVSGAGSSVETVGLFVGQSGEGNFLVKDGGVVTMSRLGVAAGAGSTGVLTVQGAGSRLQFESIPNSAAFIGVENGSRATVEIKDGAAFAVGDVAVTIGSGRAQDFSALRVTGTGTTLTDAGINVRAGGSFQLSDGAQWTGGALVVTGGEARVQANATATLSNDVIVGGLIANGSVVQTGRLNVGYGSTLTTADNVHVKQGGTISVNGTDALLQGFTTLFVDGSLNVSNGGKVVAGASPLGPGEIFVRSGGSISGSEGAIQANVTLADGTMLRPGNSPGTLMIDGNLTFVAGSRLQLEVGGAAPGSLYDQLVVTGDAMFADGAIVEFTFINGFAPIVGQTFSFLNVGGDFGFTTSPASFAVTGLADGWAYDTALIDGGFVLTSLSNGIATTSASAIPEPSTWALIVGAAALALAAGRRRFCAAVKITI